MNTDSAMLPVIVKDLCVSCGACVQVCPDRIIALDASGLAALAPVDGCMQCGHCHAVCPEEAIRVPFLDTDFTLSAVLSPEAGRSGPVAAAPLMELLSMRRSCRRFTTASVPKPILEDLVRAGTTAPSATNCQSWQFHVLPERPHVIALGAATANYYRKLNARAARPWLRFVLRMAGVRTLQYYYDNYYETIRLGLEAWDNDGTDRLFHGATAALVVTADCRASCPCEDALMASQNILLMAETMGLGTCMIGFVVEAAKRDPAIGALLDLADYQKIYSVIGIGYPDVEFERAAGRKPVQPRIVRPGDS